MKPRSEWSREEVVGFYLHTLALHLDPQHGRLSVLATAIGVDPYTISRWKAQGGLPRHQAKLLFRTYGETLAPFAELCREEERLDTD